MTDLYRHHRTEAQRLPDRAPASGAEDIDRQLSGRHLALRQPVAPGHAQRLFRKPSRFPDSLLDRLGRPLPKTSPSSTWRAASMAPAIRTRSGRADGPNAIRSTITCRTYPPRRPGAEIIGAPIPGGGFVTIYSDITERKHAEERIRNLALQDPLTHLPNRIRLNDLIDHDSMQRTLEHGELSRCCSSIWMASSRSTIPAATMPATNFATGGRSASGARYGRRIRWPALVATRFNVVLLRDIESASGRSGSPPTIIAQITRRSPYAAFRTAHRHSIGIALHPGHGDSRESLLRAADEAMYQAKAAGREPGAWPARHLEPGFGVSVVERIDFEDASAGVTAPRPSTARATRSGKACSAGRDADSTSNCPRSRLASFASASAPDRKASPRMRGAAATHAVAQEGDGVGHLRRLGAQHGPMAEGRNRHAALGELRAAKAVVVRDHGGIERVLGYCVWISTSPGNFGTAGTAATCISCANRRSGARQSAANSAASAPRPDQVSFGKSWPLWPASACRPGCRRRRRGWLGPASPTGCGVAASRSARRMRACGKRSRRGFLEPLRAAAEGMDVLVAAGGQVRRDARLVSRSDGSAGAGP